jgi:hypothetical protein
MKSILHILKNIDSFVKLQMLKSLERFCIIEEKESRQKRFFRYSIKLGDKEQNKVFAAMAEG